MEATMTTRISRLQAMGVDELREKYAEVFGKPTKSRNAPWLFKVIARKMQNDEEPESAKKPVPLPTLVAKFERKSKILLAGPSRSKRITRPVRKEVESKRASFKEPGERDPRLPKPGTTLTRHYKGKDILVRVLDDGFEWGGKQYRSLSAVAVAITGSKAINGYLWFQLGAYAKTEKGPK